MLDEVKLSTFFVVVSFFNGTTSTAHRESLRVSLASHIPLLEDPFSSGRKVGSHFLNTDLSDQLGIRSAVVNQAVTYTLALTPGHVYTIFLLKFWRFFDSFRFACPNNWR